MTLFAAASVLIFILTVLAIERIAVKRSVDSINIRILVNGTRGKSTVTRYIAAAMREAGHFAFAKVTGTVPELILPDGSGRELKRRGAARVQEQFGVIRRAASGGADSLVLECMSISPELQQLESRFYNPGVYVITNIRDDHRESMGSSPDEQAEGMISAIPPGSTVVTASGKYTNKIRDAANKRGCRVIISGEGDPDGIKRELPDHLIRENVELACRAAEVAGVDLNKALGSILGYAGEDDNKLIRMENEKGSFCFVDGFSVNDVESAEIFVTYWSDRLSLKGGFSVVLNTRADRPTRSISFAEWLAGNGRISGVAVTGSHAPAARRALKKAGFPGEHISIWKKRDITRAVALVPALCGKDSVVFGFGNIRGAGFDIPEILRNEFC
ncbi:MAG: poly-gamma-glutamate synthase PgsB [Candidatus Latescibacteria bacterium]|nr:poly-gamma-glutamate synthase PgsB [bacterium]MBD3425125.1 poly-gamma-glutamate synthase PgsB [Candidatus Latescibacterota bacterium]